MTFLSQRLMLDFQPHLERELEKAFSARGLDWRDSWHLLEMVVDPIYQNKGTFRPCSLSYNPFDDAYNQVTTH